MERIITTNLNNILSIIACAQNYGFSGMDVLFDAFSEMMGYKLTNKEIEAYSKSVLSEEGYTREDYREIKERLLEFKEKYCTKKN